jgi:MgsA AAA+ ATPase C terminal
MDNHCNRSPKSEIEFARPSLSLDAIKPLACDRWIASSALQKAIRRGEVPVGLRALRTLYRHDPRSAWRRLLVIACEDIGIGSLDAVIMAITRGTNAKACFEAGGDEAAAFATAQMLAEAPKDRSADMLCAAADHDPALEIMRATCRSVPVARRLEFVADQTLSLPERALAAWHSSGVDPRGERRVGPGDLGALMRTYAGLGVPDQLVEAVAVATKKIRDPLALFLPLLWLAAADGEPALVDVSPPPSGLIKGVPLYALDKHTRLGRQAIGRFAKQNAEIARFLSKQGCGSGDDGALRMAVFYADGALTRPTLQWRYAAELSAVGVAADFHKVHVAADVGSALVRLVAAHMGELDEIRCRTLSRALPSEPDQVSLAESRLHPIP